MRNNFIFPIVQEPKDKATLDWVIIVTRFAYGKLERSTYQYEFKDYKDASAEYSAYNQKMAEHLTLIDTSAIIGLYMNINGHLICSKQMLITSYDKP